MNTPGSPNERIRLGVITNPFSRTNARTRLYDRLLPRMLDDRQSAITTRTGADLDAALAHLVLERRVNVLGLNGGDGTLHAGVNRLLWLAQSFERDTGEKLALPTLLFLNGGTLNIVSRATGTKGNPARTVRTFMNRFRGATVGALPTKTLRMLSVQEVGDDGAASPPQLGFIFGTEIIANALEMYGLFGEGYVGFARFLGEVAIGYGVGTQLWREHGWKLDPTGRPITVDGQDFPQNLGAVAATIDLGLMKGLLTAIRVPAGGTGFVAKVLVETHPGRTIAMIPKLMVGLPAAGVHDVNDAKSLVTYGGYTLDGELHLDRSPSGARRKVVVSVSPLRLRAVALG